MTDLPPATDKACNECPWRRDSRPGHVGPLTPEEWVLAAHGDRPIACHKTIDPEYVVEGSTSWDQPRLRQCGGSAQFRTNVFKSPRDPAVATAEERDTDRFFGTNQEFIDHHGPVSRRMKRRGDVL